MQETDVLLDAQNLGIKRIAGSPFWDVSLRVVSHEIIAISGAHRSGRSALLLTLSGYMKFTHGSLKIVDAELPRERKKSRRYVGLGLFGRINEFHERQPLEEVIASELKPAIKSPLFLEQSARLINDKQAMQQYVEDTLAYWKVTSSPQTEIVDLSPLEKVRLGIALAVLKKPRLLFVDDIESALTIEESHNLLRDIHSYVRENNCSALVGVLKSELTTHMDQIVNLKDKANHVANGDEEHA